MSVDQILVFLFRISALAEVYRATQPHPVQKIWFLVAITLVFAALGRAIHGVTTSGALAGAVVCLAILWGAGFGGFAALLAVFLITWAATRIGYAGKLRLGTAEAHGGRDERQVLANLGVAALASLWYAFGGREPRLLLAVTAALAEAAADTVSSEIGQALGGIPRLITNWSKVPAGSDGAITWMGTLAGLGGAIAVASVALIGGLRPKHGLPICIVAGVAGMLADSVLGATLERRGVLGNNAVNLTSTAIAAGLALFLARVLGGQ